MKILYKLTNGAYLEVIEDKDGEVIIRLEEGSNHLGIILTRQERIRLVESIITKEAEDRLTKEIREHLLKLYKNNKRGPDNTLHIKRADNILNEVVAEMKYTIKQLSSEKKTGTLSVARAIYFYLCCKHTNLSYPFISGTINKTHASAILGEKRIKKNIKTDKDIAHIVRVIETKIKNYGKDKE